MGSDPDAPWRPGYDGPPLVAAEFEAFRTPSTRSVGEGAEVDDAGESAAHLSDAAVRAIPREDVAFGVMESGESHAGTRGWRRIVPIVVATAVVLAGVVVVRIAVTPDLAGSADSAAPAASAEAAPGDQPPTPSADDSSSTLVEPASLDQTGGTAFVGADPRRLPRRVDPLWTVSVGSDDVPSDVDEVDPMLAIVDSRFVVVLAATPSSSDTSTLRLLDAVDGTERWNEPLAGAVSSFRVIGAVDDALLVESSLDERRVAAYSLDTGSPQWVRSEAPEQVGVPGVAEGFEILAGTPLLARRPLDENDPTILIDPATGSEVGRLDGEVLGTDSRGMWFVSSEDGIVAHDLSDGFAPGSVLVSFADADLDAGIDAASVVDGRVVAAVREQLLVARVQGAGLATTMVEFRPRGVTLPTSIVAVEAMVGSTMLVAGGGRVVGAELEGNLVRPVWDRRGVVVQTTPTDTGTVLLVATDGGATQEIVDGRTGRTLLALTLAPGVFDSLLVAGNGIVARRSSPDGPRMSGLDLDGREMWSLPGSEQLAVGDGIVARVEPGIRGPVVTVYGDADDSTGS